MSDNEEGRQMAGVGVVRVDPDLTPGNHMENFNTALQKALDNFGRAEGYYRVQVTFQANVRKVNPGQVVEYIVTLT